MNAVLSSLEKIAVGRADVVCICLVNAAVGIGAVGMHSGINFVEGRSCGIFSVVDVVEDGDVGGVGVGFVGAGFVTVVSITDIVGGLGSNRNCGS